MIGSCWKTLWKVSLKYKDAKNKDKGGCKKHLDVDKEPQKLI